FQGACDGFHIVSDICLSAINRYCQALGYANGFGPNEFDGVHATVTCVGGPASMPITTTFTALGNYDGLCNQAAPTSYDCMSASHRYCRARGYASGFGAIEHFGNTAWISCIAASL